MGFDLRPNLIFSHLTVYEILVGTASRRLHEKYYRDHQKNLDHKFQLTALVSFSLSLGDGAVRSLRTIVTWTMSSSVSGTSRSVSSLLRCVETAVRPKVVALLSDQLNSFGVPLWSLVLACRR